MTKAGYFILLLCFTSCLCYGQALPILWQHSYGGGDDEWDAYIRQACGVGYVLGGTTTSNGGDVLKNNGGSDYSLMRISNSGDIVWQQSYGGSEYEYLGDVLTTGDGYMLAGFTGSTDGDVTDFRGGLDAWLVKTDTAGTLKWQKTYGGSSADQPGAIIKTPGNGYLFVGNSMSSDSGLHNYGNADFWVVKIDDTGGMQWQKTYGGSAVDIATSVVRTSDNGFVVAGYSASNDTDVTGNHGLYDLWVIRIDDTGRLLWQKSYGGSGFDLARSILPASDGGFIVSGSTTSNDGDVTGYHGGSTYYGDIWVIKIDDTGKLQWQKTYGGAGDEEAYGIGATSNGYAIAGYTTSTSGIGTGKHDTTDFWVIRIDDTGALLWQKPLGGSGREYGHSILVVSDSVMLVAGATNSNDGDITVNKGGGDFWLVRLGQSVAAVQQAQADNALHVYPNPAQDKLTITMDHNGHEPASIAVFDIMGQKTELHFDPLRHELNVHSLPPGFYQLVYTTQSISKTTTFIKQ